MADKVRAAGMEQDPEFVRRTAEYRKTRLINVHRTELINDWTPSDDELQGWFLEHMDSITVPEARKVQMVVLKTKQEAEDIKAQIDSGKLTMFQAAQQYSLDPNAKTTLGEMGWVSHGTGYPELDDFTFSLEPDVIVGPVESPTGWHLVKVLDVRDAQFQNIDDAATRKRTLRMYMKDRLNNYVVDLRKNRFKVVVYDDELTRQFQKEADYIAALNKKAMQEGSVTKQRQKELEKSIVTPPQ
jgi:parvulin-like peptidyl-prolyl isomerase